MSRHGFLRVAALSPPTVVANPVANAAAILKSLEECPDADVVVFPELCLTGYTAADLFAQDDLMEATSNSLYQIAKENTDERILIVGLPLPTPTGLFNVAAVLSKGKVRGFVPKQYLPTYGEFYEQRWFQSAGSRDSDEVHWYGAEVPFGINLMFHIGGTLLGVEICEDLWVPLPPSSFQALAGAELLVNLSASTELVGKANWRRQLVLSQSGRCLAGYVYAGAGPTESTTDVVFGGHCLIAENGVLLSESRRVGDGKEPSLGTTSAIADIDLERLRHDRQRTNTFFQGKAYVPYTFRIVSIELSNRDWTSLRRPNPGTPFVPEETTERSERCNEIFGIQAAGLATRVRCLPEKTPLVIGVSGGLDSTLALLAAVRTMDEYHGSRQRIEGILMPGFGTTTKSLEQGTQLVQSLGIRWTQIDIRELCLQTFRALGHDPLGIRLTAAMTVDQLQEALIGLPGPSRSDLVFENVQARIRTLVLMSRGFVLGTGDMSEQALGWSTYNGDHISMYNVNTSVPKTLVRFLVRHAADHQFAGKTRELLHQIASATITPELLPTSAKGEVVQKTEEQIGPYELHDFFLYHMIRHGFTREKIQFLALQATFSRTYSSDEIRRTLTTFYERFFGNQFKRSCVPDGPKVGTVSLSPRGDWRMPSDANPGPWLNP